MAHGIKELQSAVISGLSYPASSVRTFVGRTLLHPFNSLFSRKIWVSQYQEGINSLDLYEARDDGFWDGSGISWTICKQSAPCSGQKTTPSPQHCRRDTHTHTHPFNGPLSGTSQVSRYQKGGTVDVNLLMITMSVAVESR